ncbi:leucine-rich repeat protein soc-2 homolog isoform X4 [Schistocerca piceifrons]|nr:leucine-rich repeat protein soc-2 homolog isoform X4 [Schistocerca piceifrons]
MLNTLGIRGNLLMQLPEEIGYLGSLRWLTVENNQVSEVPESFSQLENLIHFNISKNNIHKIPTVIAEMKLLQYCYLRDNFIEEIPVEFMKNVKHIKKLDVTGNPLSSLPSEIEKFPNLWATKTDIMNSEDLNQTSESESEDWENSVASSEIDSTDASHNDEESDDEDQYEPAAFITETLPGLCKFLGSGI